MALTWIVPFFALAAVVSVLLGPGLLPEGEKYQWEIERDRIESPEEAAPSYLSPYGSNQSKETMDLLEHIITERHVVNPETDWIWLSDVMTYNTLTSSFTGSGWRPWTNDNLVCGCSVQLHVRR